MARPKKEGEKMTFLVDKGVAELLNTFCEETGRTKTKVVELAIKEFVENHTKK